MDGDALIINLAPTGMVPTREMAPQVPFSTEEILADVERCRAHGAAIIHVHARDDDGKPSHRAEHFAPIVEGIRAIDPELVVCVTCSGRFAADLEARAEVLSLEGEAKPDMASLTLGSNNFARQASLNAPETIRGLAERMRERAIKPELEVFEPGMVAFGRHLVERGLIEPPCYVNILLGNPGTARLSPGSLGGFLAELPEDWTWAVAGIGRDQLAANAMAIAAGGHVRVGLEDNLWWDRARTTPATNEQLVRRVARLAEQLERPLATPAEVRRRLGLRPGRRAAFRGPERVADAPTLAAIYRLRAAVWRDTGAVAQAAFADGRWSDEHDPASLHWVIRDAGELVAAARLSVHERLADVPEAEAYAAVGLRLAGRIAAPARVVVAPAARRHGLAWQLLDAQDAAARAAGCAFAVRQSTPAMRRLLTRRGWYSAGPARRDERFPGVSFEVMVLELAP